MKKIIFFVFVVLYVGLLSAETVEIFPSDDMYTDEEHPMVSPDTSQLWTANFDPTGHHERIMFRFDLGVYTGRVVTSAVLHLSRLYSCPSGGTTATTFYAIASAWDEESWPCHTHIPYLSQYNMPYVFRGTGGVNYVPFAVNISSLVTLWINGEIPNYGFVIEANAGQKFSKFYSKEHAYLAYRPFLEITLEETSIADAINTPLVSHINNYPNPFNPATTISFTIADSEMSSLQIINIHGQVVKNYPLWKSGKHLVSWDGTNNQGDKLASGIYFARLRSRSQMQVHKMLLLK